jgi:CheY-like chemotaxis protein
MLVLFQRILGKEGYEVVAVSSGEEALKQSICLKLLIL